MYVCVSTWCCCWLLLLLLFTLASVNHFGKKCFIYIHIFHNMLFVYVRAHTHSLSLIYSPVVASSLPFSVVLCFSFSLRLWSGHVQWEFMCVWVRSFRLCTINMWLLLLLFFRSRLFIYFFFLFLFIYFARVVSFLFRLLVNRLFVIIPNIYDFYLYNKYEFDIWYGCLY